MKRLVSATFIKGKLFNNYQRLGIFKITLKTYLLLMKILAGK